jgi:hypothetical protein
MSREPSRAFSEANGLAEALAHPRLARYSPSERRAILCHHAYLASLRPGLDVEASAATWEAGACHLWRREKMRRDCQEQLQQIEVHRQQLGRALKREVNPEFAARDWILKHAAAWRVWWEQQPESTPLVFPHSLAEDAGFCANRRLREGRPEGRCAGDRRHEGGPGCSSTDTDAAAS